MKNIRPKKVKKKEVIRPAQVIGKKRKQKQTETPSTLPPQSPPIIFLMVRLVITLRFQFQNRGKPAPQH